MHPHTDFTNAELKKNLPPDINDKYLSHKVNEIKHLKKIKWDISSPRFARAQLNLGLKDADLIL